MNIRRLPHALAATAAIVVLAGCGADLGSTAANDGAASTTRTQAVTVADALADDIAVETGDTSEDDEAVDLDLPDGPGEWVLREVRSRHLGTRVAVCSGISDPTRLATVRGLGPEMMLWKPIELAPVFRLCAAARGAIAS